MNCGQEDHGIRKKAVEHKWFIQKTEWKQTAVKEEENEGGRKILREYKAMVEEEVVPVSFGHIILVFPEVQLLLWQC